MADPQARNQTLENRVENAVTDFRKNNPSIKIEQYQLDGLLDAARDWENTHSGQKLTQAQIQTVLSQDLQEKNISTQKITSNIGEAVTGSFYGIDGIANQSIGRALQTGTLLQGGATAVSLRLAGPVAAVGLGAYDTVSGLREGNNIKAGQGAGGALGSIFAAAGAGALMGSFVPGAGNVVGAAVGFIAGVGGYYAGKWAGGSLAETFSASADPKEKSIAPQPLAQPLVPSLHLKH